MRRPLALSIVALGVLIACDEPVEPPATGSIALRLVVPEPEVTPPAPSPAGAGLGAAVRSERMVRVPGEPETGQENTRTTQPRALQSGEPSFDVAGHLTKAQVKLEGPTPKDTTINPLPAGGTTLRITGLTPGTYNVLVFGMVGDSVDYFGRLDGISVTAGGRPTATVTFQTFRPNLLDFTTPTSSFTVRAVFRSVASASTYRVEWARNASFTGSTSASVTPPDTTYLMTLADTGTYYTRIFAQNAAVTTPRASDTKTFRVFSDNVTDDPAGSPPLLRNGFGAVIDTVTGVNIWPAGDKDIYGLTACSLDTLEIETFAARLVPVSGLNTVLRLLASNGTTQIAANDDVATGVTDSRILVVAPIQDTFKIEVSGSGGTTGRYELFYRVRVGPNNQGTTCVPQVDLSKSTITVSQETVAAGSTATLTLTARDAAGVQLPSGGATVAFQVSGGTSTGAIGPVTDNGDGTYTAQFSGQIAGTASQVGATYNGAPVTSTKPTLTVTAGPAAKLGFRTQPAGATAGDSIQPVVEIVAQDAFGNFVSTATGAVTVALGTNPAGGSLFGLVTKNLIGGVAAFANLKVDKAASGYTLVATHASLTSVTSNPFDITPAQATRLSFVVQPTTAIAGDTLQPVVVAIQDALGNTVPLGNQVSVTLATNPTGAVLSGRTAVNAVAGLATFDTLIIDKTGTGYQLRADATLLASATSNPFNVAIGTPVRLAFTVEPTDAVAGVPLAPAVKVTILDAAGNVASTATDSVTLSLSADPSGGAATFGGTKKVAAVAGVATFADLTLNKAVAGYRILASSGTLVPDTSAAFQISPAPKAKLAFVVQPATTPVNTAITPAPQVAIRDAFDNLVTSATDAVNLGIGTNPSGGALFGNTSVVAVGGIATFSGVSLNAVGTGYTLTATATGLTGTTSDAFNVTAGTPVKLGFSVQPVNTPLGTIIPAVSVAVQDGAGTTITGATNTVTLALGSNPTGAVLGGDVEVDAVDGVATFSDLTLDRVGTGYTLTATATGLTGATSNTFNVTVGAPAKLSFSVEPTNAVAGGAIAPAIQVTIQDQGGNTVTSATANVTLAFLNDPSGGAATLGGTLTVAAVSGVATFSDITVNRAFSDYTLRATSGTLGSDTSAAFDISPAAPAGLAWTTQPTSVVAGTSISPSPQVTVRDAFGNAVPSATNAVSVAIGTNPSGGTLYGTTSVSASGGVATFSDLSIDLAGAGYTLTASSPGLTGATSAGFVVTASGTVSASLSTAVASPATNVLADGFQLSAITVTVRDVNGNPIEGQQVQIAASGTGNTITQPGALTNASGQATGTITSSRAELKTITVTVNPSGTPVVLTQQPTVQFVADPSTISPSLSTATATPAEPDSLRADGIQQAAIVVTVRDANDNPVPGQTVELATSGLGTLTQPGTTNGSGVAVGSIASTNASSDTITVTVNPAGTPVVLDSRPSVKFWVAPCGLPDAVQSTVALDATNVPANGTDVVTVTVTVIDCSGGTPVSGQVVEIAASGSGNTVTQPSGTTDGSGQASGTVASTVAGAKTITVTVNPGPDQIVLQSRPTVTFDPGAPTQVAFTVQPSNAAAGASINPAIQVAIQDALGNTVDTAAGNVTLAIDTDPLGGTTLFGTLTMAAVNGVATFSDVNLRGVASGFTLQASYGALPAAVSSAFSITPGAPAALDVTTQPTNIAAGSAITPAVQVTIRDAYGNPVTTATNAVTLGIGTNPGGGSLLGTVTRNAVAGVATFTGLSVNKSGTGYTLTASASGLTDDTSDPFDVTAGSPAQVRFTVEPSTAAAGASITPAVQVAIQDAFGNTVTGATDDVSVALAANPGGATLSGTTTVAAVAGLVTFSNLSLNVATSGYTLRATSGTLVADTSVAFTVTAGNPTQLAIVTEPSDAQAGVAISPAVLAVIRDAFGNTVTTASDSVVISISTDPVGGTTLFGTTRVAAAGGFATFNAVNIRAVGTGFRLRVTSGALTPDTTVAFNITPGSPAQLAFTTQPGNITAGVNFSPAVQVAVRDAYGNNVTTATNTIALGIGANPGGASLLGSPTQSAVAGVATFSAVSLNKSGTGYTLTASSTGLSTGTSAAFDVTAAAKDRLGFLVQPSETPAGAAITPAVQVAIQDAFGNTVSSAADSVIVAIGTDPAGGSSLGGATRVAAVAGVAMFSTLSINKAGAGFTLVTSSGSLAGATSNAFTITSGGATQLAFVQQPTNATAGAAISPAVTVEARDGLGNKVTAFEDSVTISIANNAGGGTLSGTLKVKAAAGVATFSDLSIDRSGTGYTLQAARSGLSSGTSGAFSITAGSPKKLGFVAEPSTAPAGDVITPAVQVAVQDSLSNTVTTATNGITVEIQDNPSGGTLFGTKTQLAAAGVATFSNLTIDIAGVGYTLKATSTGLDSATSAAFTITAGAVDTTQSTVTVDPTSQIADGVQTSTITVTVKDASGTPVPGRTVQLTATGSGNTLTQPSAVTNESGVATGTIASAVAEAKTIEATVDPGGAAKVIAQRPVVTFVGDPGNVSATLSTVVTDKTVAVANESDFITVTVTVKDAGGNPVEGQTVQLTATGSGNTISGAVTTNASGVAVGTVASSVAEVKTITVIVNPGSGQRVLATQPSVTFVPGPPARVGFVVQPSNIAAGDPITAPVQVAVQDANGNTIPTATDNITLAIQGGKAGAALLGTYPVAAVSGVATFSDLSVDSAAAGYQLVATSGSLSAATSGAFDVSPGAAESVQVTPAGAQLTGVGSSTPAFSVEARDRFRNLIPSPAVLWESLNWDVATLSGSGVATASGAGQAVVQAVVGDAVGYALVTVQVPGVTAANVFGEAGSGTTETFRGLWGASSTDIFAVGLNGTIAHYDGISWSIEPTGVSVTLRGVWGAAPNDVVAVGGNGTILRYRGASWSAEASGTTEALASVWGSSPNDIYAVGTGGTVVHYDGDGWTVDTTGLAGGATLTAVWGTSVNDIFVATNQGPGVGSPILHFDGTTWTEQANPTNEAMLDLWGVAPDTVFAVGDDGFVLRYNGTTWSLTTTLPVAGAFLNAIWGTATSDVYVVSQDRRMFHYDGSTWAERAVPASAPDLFDLWGSSSAASVYIAGAGGLIARGFRGGSVVVAPAVDTLVGVGDTLRLDVEARDIGLSPIPGVPFIWASSDDGVATVDSTGKVTAVAQGVATITATAAGGASDDAAMTIRVPASVVVTPGADTTFTLGDQVQFAGAVLDGNGDPLDGFTLDWRTTDTLIAAVDGSGLATARERGRVRVIAELNGLADTASFVVGVRMALIAGDPLYPGYWWLPVPTQAFADPDTLTSDIPGHLDTLTAAAFNAMSPADLRAQYDVIGFGWYADAAADADWTTRLRPYIELGGGVIFEDPRNVADLAPGVTGAELDQVGPWTLHAVPALTDGTTNDYMNTHLVFTAWDTLFAPFITKESAVEGLYGRVGAGCFVATGPDHMFHGYKGAGGTEGNHYNFFLNQVKWVTRCPLNSPPGPTSSVIVYPDAATISESTIGTTTQLYGVARDSMGTPIPGATITWTSTDEAVVQVDADGLVMSVDNGTAQIIASGSGADTATITVDVPASSIQVSPASATVTVGTGTVFTHQAFDAAMNPITRAVTWSSLNPNVATAGPGTGDATPVENGQVAIRASADGVNGYGLLTVRQAPPGVRTNAWSAMTSGTTSSLFGVWGSAANNVFAVGSSGTIRRYNGSTWETHTSGTSADLWDVWGSSASDVWAVGGGGTVRHYNGSSWTVNTQRDTTGLGSWLYRVWGTAPNNVYAAGDGGIWRFDGTSWSQMPGTGFEGQYAYGVWGTSPTDIFVAGYASGTGVVRHFDGSGWTTVHSSGSESYYGVWGAASDDVYAVGDLTIQHWDGSAWTEMAKPAGLNWLWSVWGTSSNEVFAAGSGNNIAQYDGFSWTAMATTSTGAQFRAVWGRQGDDIVAVGGAGSIYRETRGATVTQVTMAPVGALLNVGGSATFTATPRDAGGNPVSYEPAPTYASLNTDVATINASTGLASVARDGQATLAGTVGGLTGYAVLTGQNPAPTAVNLWDSTASPASGWIWGVWGTSASNVFAGGAAGILRYNGSTWTQVYSGCCVRNFWGSDPTDLWAVDGNGILRSTNGTSWSTHTSGTGSYGIWGAAPNDIWAVGSSSIYHYDGSTWSAHTPSFGFLWSVWGANKNFAVAVGSGGRIVRWNGTSWTADPQSQAVTTAELYRVWGTSASNVYAVGSSGTIIRFNGSTWSTVASGTSASLYGVWGSGPSDIYAVGSPISGVGVITRFDGSSWSPQFPLSRTTTYIYGVWGTGTGNVWLGIEGGQIRRGVRGGSLTAIPIINFIGTNLRTKMNIASNGSTYHYANGGVAADGKLYEYSLAGSFIDSAAVTSIDQRSILYRAGTYYLKSYGQNWYTVNAQTGATSLVFSGGFGGGTSSQSVPAVSLTGTFEIWEFCRVTTGSCTANTIRRLNSAGGLIGTVTGVAGTTEAVATDGYYVYTQSGTTINVYDANRIQSGTASLIGTFTVPSGTALYSLSYANGMLWTSDGTRYYGYRVGVTP